MRRTVVSRLLGLRRSAWAIVVFIGWAGCRASPTPAPEGSERGPSAAPRPAKTQSPFELIATRATVRVFDFGAQTLLLGPGGARLVAPRESIAHARDVSRGLPLESLGDAPVRCLAPHLGVGRHPWGTGDDFAWYFLSAQGWRPVALPANVSTLLPLGTAALAIEWATAPDGDPSAVPAGNTTRAWRVFEDSVERIEGWPNGMTWSQMTAGESVWAIAARPGQPGKFLLHLSARGAAALFPIPGRATCRGLDRADGTESVVDATDDEAIVDLYDLDAAPTCKPDHQGSGRFRFSLSSQAWKRVGDSPGTSRTSSRASPSNWSSFVAAAGAEFRIEGGRVTIRVEGREDRYTLGAAGFGELMVTAAGREVWAVVGQTQNSALYRYAWPPTPQ